MKCKHLINAANKCIYNNASYFFVNASFTFTIHHFMMKDCITLRCNTLIIQYLHAFDIKLIASSWVFEFKSSTQSEKYQVKLNFFERSVKCDDQVY